MFRNPQMKKFIGSGSRVYHRDLGALRCSFGRSFGRVRLSGQKLLHWRWSVWHETSEGAYQVWPSTDMNYNRTHFVSHFIKNWCCSRNRVMWYVSQENSISNEILDLWMVEMFPVILGNVCYYSQTFFLQLFFILLLIWGYCLETRKGSHEKCSRLFTVL